ncbi:hypothetical protein DJ568_08845 [Mucilaginibacter hurinus]|uniref:Ricin B lectin domain-containing protein n=1 Tax=Mucilaginibacter hurinus TaxID=2201324 RepID=A0A367GPS1_9SPHI|nr:DUF5005 domain-containing protein [Mucilaginibacter hurinus]RCH55280.1 hypothetical protein DJ568_08845 [Mucilaginibacter hurinus]
MRKQLTYALMASCCLFAASCKKNEPGAQANQSKNQVKRIDVAGEMTGVIPTGVYRFVPETTDASTPQKSIGVVDSSSTVNGKLIESRDFAHNRGQEWQVTSLGSGQYRIVNINSGKALDVPGGTADENEQLWQQPVNTTINGQKWVIEQQGSNAYYRIKTVVNTARGLHVAATTNGTAVRNNAYAGQTANKGYFRIYRVAYKDKAATNFFKRTTGWTNGDGATSVKLSNGKVLWLMDDSGLNLVHSTNGTIPCIFSVNNCAILQSSTTNWSNTATTLTGTGNPYGLFRSNTTSSVNYNWTSSGFEISGTAYIFCSSMTDTGHIQNDALGKFNISTNTVIGYQTLQSFYRADLDAADGDGEGIIEFGRGFHNDGTYVYAWGQHKPWIGGDVYVARFPATTAGVAGAWSFWNGSSWVAGVNNAAIIGYGDAPNPFICKVGTKYLMFSNELSTACNQGTKVYVNVANNPYGPFNYADRKHIYTMDDKFSGNSPWFYWAQGHPEHIANGEILVTYNLNGAQPCIACSGANNPDLYRPKAIRVPLKMIDPSL